MNLEYFENHIKEELEGAEDYIKQAIEIRAMTQTWAKSLVEMSAAELQHATNLYKMFEEFYVTFTKPYSEIPEYISDTKERITNCFAKKYAKVKAMHEAYSK